MANNYTYIDSQNLYLAIKELGWKVDYRRFRIYLKEKYSIEKAYMFMGFLPGNQMLYTALQKAGFILVFRPILENGEHPIKGNCDAELVLYTMIDWPRYDKALIVTGDGDFYCLINHLIEHNKLLKVLAPSPKNCSSLLRRAAGNKISFVSDLKKKSEYIKRKKPHKDKTL